MTDMITPSVLKQRAASLGVTLPEPPEPKGDYQPAVVHDGLIYTSGMGPMLGGVRHHLGYVGGDVTVEDAQQAAGIAAVNALMAAVAVAGGIEHVGRIVRVTGFVRSAPGFVRQTTVVDGASQVLIGLLGASGAHARSAIGVAELPFGIPVEIELIAAYRPGRDLQ